MVTEVQKSELNWIKDSVENSHNFFKDNFCNYNEMMDFIFVSTISQSEANFNRQTKRPNIEFNISEQYISKLRGEFSKLEPSVLVTSSFGSNTPASTIKFVEDHMRQILFNARIDGVQDDVLNQSCGGGFSVMKVRTDYEHDGSMKQNIFLDRVFYPTLCGFDPAAIKCHKGDGEYAFELFPLTKSQFENDYPGIDLDDIDFKRSDVVDSFNWSYKNNDEEFVLVCHFYKKEYRRYKLYELADGSDMPKDRYDEMVANWDEVGVPPVVVNERWAKICNIYRYEVIENMVVGCVKTDFKSLPLIFVDGNSVNLTHKDNGAFRQITRSYIKNAKGAQQLKNLAGQSLSNELINMIQHKLMVAQESLPDNEQWLEPYTNFQVADTIVYKALYENDVSKQLPPPQVIPRQPIPAEIINTFVACDDLMQKVLGSYNPGVNPGSSQLSGKAILEGQIQSNSAAMPFITNYLTSMTQALNVISEIIPSIYSTQRMLPVRSSDGSSNYTTVNSYYGPSAKFQSGTLKVNVSAGASFSVQKSKSIDQMTQAMQVYPAFAQLMNEKGLSIFVNNMEMLQQEELKADAQEFMQEQQQQKQQAMQQQQQQGQQQNPMIQLKQQEMQMKNQIEQQKLQLQSQQMQLKAQYEQQQLQHQVREGQVGHMLQSADLSIKKQNADTAQLAAEAQAGSADVSNQVQLEKADNEKARTQVDLATAELDHATKIHELNKKENDYEY